MEEFEVIIIGGGPAGLSAAYHLKRLGISSLVLEQGPSVGESWQHMPDQLSLVSLWKSNCLLPEDRFYFSPFSQVRAKDFAAYLKHFAKKHALRVQTGSEVTAVKQSDEGFSVTTKSGEFKSTFVINATGYYSFPWVPEVLKEIKDIPVLHMKDYKNPKQVQSNKRILIVGKRLSAGQLIEELADGHELALSTRSPLEFSSAPWLYNFFLLILDEAEAVMKKLRPFRELEVKMEAKVKPFFKRFSIPVYPEIRGTQGKRVSFTDGKEADFDLIIAATGFVPRWPYLGDLKVNARELELGLEANEVPGLFFLGLGEQRSFVSRFLRGIREDAPALACVIRDRLARKVPHKK